MPSQVRVGEVVRLASEHLAVALVKRAAHAVNFSHPKELAKVLEAWLDGALVDGDAQLPAGVRVIYS